MTLPLDFETFKDVVIADARGVSESDDPASFNITAEELRDPANLTRWRGMLVAIVREIDVQYASRRKAETGDKLILANAEKEYLAFSLKVNRTPADEAAAKVKYHDAKMDYLAARLIHDSWRASVAKFRAGIETSLREARALMATDYERMRQAILDHQTALLAEEDNEPTEYDLALWKVLE